MTSIAASSLQPHVDIEQASHHLEVVYRNAHGFGSLILLGNGRRERHCFFNAAELTDDPSTVDDSREALQDVVDNRWNVYASLAAFTQTPERGRGTRADVASIPGVWADLDVKPDVEGYYRNEHELTSYVQYLPQPTLEVASGSGGRHLYWLTHGRVDAKDGQALLLAWLDFLRQEAGTNTIENVHDTTRILRLAGTVRWPKVADPVAPMPHPVSIVSEGPRYHAEELHTLAAPAHQAAQELRAEARRQRVDERDKQRAQLTHRGLTSETFDRVVMVFNAAQDWQPLLEAAGWTLHSDERGGVARCRFWTRPGKSVADGKSAATDFTNDDGTISRMMTVYTKDPGLQPLWENADSHDGVGIVSKWRFATTCLSITDTALFHAVRKTGRLP